MSPLGPLWTLHLGLPDPGLTFLKEEEVEQIVYP